MCVSVSVRMRGCASVSSCRAVWREKKEGCGMVSPWGVLGPVDRSRGNNAFGEFGQAELLYPIHDPQAKRRDYTLQRQTTGKREWEMDTMDPLKGTEQEGTRKGYIESVGWCRGWGKKACKGHLEEPKRRRPHGRLPSFHQKPLPLLDPLIEFIKLPNPSMPALRIDPWAIEVVCACTPPNVGCCCCCCCC